MFRVEIEEKYRWIMTAAKGYAPLSKIIGGLLPVPPLPSSVDFTHYFLDWWVCGMAFGLLCLYMYVVVSEKKDKSKILYVKAFLYMLLPTDACSKCSPGINLY